MFLSDFPDHLLSLTEEVQGEVGRLAERAIEEDVPSLGLSAQVELRDESAREAFMIDVRQVFEALATKYGATSGDSGLPSQAFRMALACYPKGDDE